MSPPLHLTSRTLDPGDYTSVSLLAFELSVETKEASPRGLAVQIHIIQLAKIHVQELTEYILYLCNTRKILAGFGVFCGLGEGLQQVYMGSHATCYLTCFNKKYVKKQNGKVLKMSIVKSSTVQFVFEVLHMFFHS